MSTSFMGPDADVAATNGTVTPGTSDAWEVLADSNAGSYVALSPGQYVWCTMSSPNPSVPAGGTVVKVDLYLTGFPAGQATDLGRIIAQTTLSVSSATSTRRYVMPSGQTKWVGSYIIGSYLASDTSFAIVHTGTSGAVILQQVAAVVTWVAEPVVNVTAPSGTLTENNRPTVTWTNTLDPAGGAQFAAEIKIFNDAQYGAGGFDPSSSSPYTSGSVVGQGKSWRVPVMLPNDTYRAYVKTIQFPYFQVEVESDWDYNDFVESVDPPVVPDLAVTAEPAATPVGRMKIDIDKNAPGVDEATTNQIQVQRLEGSDWVDIRTILGDGLIGGTFPATIYDYEAPIGEVVSYRARAIHNYTTADAYSAWTSTVTATLSPTSWSLIHPTTPSLSRNVTPTSGTTGTISRDARQSIKQALGRSDAVAINDTRGPQTGEIEFNLAADADRDAAMALADLGVPLLLRPAAGHHEPARWVLLGDEAITRYVDAASFVRRRAAYAWIEVEAPAGDLAAWT